MSRTACALLLVLLPLGLAACTVPSATLQGPFTASLGAADLFTWYRYDRTFYDSGLCAFTSDRDLRAGPGQVLIGADNDFYDSGGAFPCIRKNDYVFRGAIRFNLAEFRSFSQIVIQKATISWKIDSAVVRDRYGNPVGVSSGPDSTNCVGALMEGVQSPASQTGFAPGVPFRSGQGDVTSPVQSWIMGNNPNFGFVLVGLDESYSRNNAACLNWISHITLTFTYLRA